MNLKSVPKAAWIIGGGLGIGAAVFALRSRSSADTTDPTVADGTSAPAGQPGIVVPAINLPQNTAGEQGTTALAGAYNATLAALLAQYGIVLNGGGPPTTPGAHTPGPPSPIPMPRPIPMHRVPSPTLAPRAVAAQGYRPVIVSTRRIGTPI